MRKLLWALSIPGSGYGFLSSLLIFANEGRLKVPSSSYKTSLGYFKPTPLRGLAKFSR